ncbi:MAG TPA: COX15/CtaA family protein, partial [Pirellulaceae bacterium]|nr:COX15/CtaA family protein [Pirellulaceae bacterium]
SPWPFRLAVALALATFPLIWVGGLVTTTDAGMAVPDWPGTYGYNLFLYPWQTWLFGPWDLFIEHGHRLLGAVVGLIAIALVVVVWLCDARLWLRYAALGALALVIFQGVLGGVRVLLDQRLVAMIHGCVAPLFFAYAASLVVFTSRWWRDAPMPGQDAAGRRLTHAAWILVGVAYVQFVLGAMLRHPLFDLPSLFRGAVLLHVIVAIVLLVQAALFHVSALGSGCLAGRGVRWGSLLAVLLIAGQLILGGSTWVVKYAWPAWLDSFQFAAAYTVQEQSIGQSLIVTTHVANGALILVALVVQAWSLSRRFFFLADAAGALEIRLVRAAA